MLIEKMKSEITAYLENFSRSVIRKYSQYDTENGIDEISSYIQRNGKLHRPILVLIVYTIYGGRTIEEVLPAAAAVELFHLFALAHDDMIDGDSTRNGGPSLGTGFSTADTTARRILLGDIVHTLAYQSLYETKINADILKAVTNVLTRTSIITGLGVLSETRQKKRDIADKKNTFGLYDRKTGYYSFSGPMITGYLLSGKNETGEKEKLEKTGLLLGRAYQLLDDYTDGEYHSWNRDDIFSSASSCVTDALSSIDCLNISSKNCTILRDFLYSLFPLLFG